MRTATWLRLAGGLTLFLAAGHTVGAVLAGPSHGPEEVALRDAMQAYRVVEMGMERSYWDFYLGSGWAITALLLATAGVMWFLAPLADRSPREVRSVVWVLALGYAAVCGISLRYFVTAPIAVTAAITVCLVAAAATMKTRAQLG